MKEPVLIQKSSFRALEPALIMDRPEIRSVNAAEDLFIADMIDAAQDAYENYTNNILRSSVWELRLDAFPVDAIETPAPLVRVVSITYLDAEGALQTLAADLYVVDISNPHVVGRIFPAYSQTWPATYEQANATTVRFEAGFADAASIPAVIKQGLLWKIQEMYDGDDRAAAYESCWKPFKRMYV